MVSDCEVVKNDFRFAAHPVAGFNVDPRRSETSTRRNSCFATVSTNGRRLTPMQNRIAQLTDSPQDHLNLRAIHEDDVRNDEISLEGKQVHCTRNHKVKDTSSDQCQSSRRSDSDKERKTKFEAERGISKDLRNNRELSNQPKEKIATASRSRHDIVIGLSMPPLIRLHLRPTGGKVDEAKLENNAHQDQTIEHILSRGFRVSGFENCQPRKRIREAQIEQYQSKILVSSIDNVAVPLLEVSECGCEPRERPSSAKAGQYEQTEDDEDRTDV